MNNAGQSKKWSHIEAFTSLAVGFIVALIVQLIVFPWYGLETTFGNNLQITLWFTVASWIRGYYMRRLFNWIHTR